MVGPVVAPLAFGIAGWISGEWAGLVVGVGVGMLLTAAIAAGAVWWSRTIGEVLEPEDAWANAPRPPGFGPMCEWIYERTLRVRGS